jgi:hypothetical protein
MCFIKRPAWIASWCAVMIVGALTPAISSAGTIYSNWNYAIDSQSDGSGAASGFEMRGMAFREFNGSAYFAISSKMPLGGIPWGGALNNAISFGDLFLNFSPHNLDTTGEFTDPQVLGIRFDSSNDSLNNIGGSNTTLGVYANVTPVDKSLQNIGYATLQQYYNSGFGAPSGAMGDLNTTADVIGYLGNGAMSANIGSGTKIGDIALLNESALALLGLDFSHFGANPAGNHIFGFSFDSSLLPKNSPFKAHVFYECINDGVALFGQTSTETTTVETPEPGSMMLALSGLATLMGCRFYSRKRNVAMSGT